MTNYVNMLLTFLLGMVAGAFIGYGDCVHAQESVFRDTYWCETYQDTEVRDLCMRFDAHRSSTSAWQSHYYQHLKNTGITLIEDIKGRRQ